MQEIKITHKMLVQAAKRWLDPKCRVVLSEIVCPAISEIPDVIGFRGSGHSISIECKVSRSDFLRDAKKVSRRFCWSVGIDKYYMAPKNILHHDEIEETWGLLIYTTNESGYTISIAKKPTAILSPESTVLVLQNEKAILISATARALKALSLVRPMSLGEENEN